MAYDLGYFGPDSVTWRLHADPMLWVGGRAGAVPAGAAPAGDGRRRAALRLPRRPVGTAAPHRGRTSATSPSAPGPRRTGPRRGSAACTGGCAGSSPSPGSRTGSTTRELLLWVHCCEVDSFLSVARRAGLRLSDADADRYVAEQVRCGRADRHPATGRRRGRSPSWRRTSTGSGPSCGSPRRPGRPPASLLAPPMPLLIRLAVPARPAWAGAAGLAFALQPPWARRLYRLPGLPSTDLAATLAAARAADRVCARCRLGCGRGRTTGGPRPGWPAPRSAGSRWSEDVRLSRTGSGRPARG